MPERRFLINIVFPTPAQPCMYIFLQHLLSFPRLFLKAFSTCFSESFMFTFSRNCSNVILLPRSISFSYTLYTLWLLSLQKVTFIYKNSFIKHKRRYIENTERTLCRSSRQGLS